MSIFVRNHFFIPFGFQCMRPLITIIRTPPGSFIFTWRFTVGRNCVLLDKQNFLCCDSRRLTFCPWLTLLVPPSFCHWFVFCADLRRHFVYLFIYMELIEVICLVSEKIMIDVGVRLISPTFKSILDSLYQNKTKIIQHHSVGRAARCAKRNHSHEW